MTIMQELAMRLVVVIITGTLLIVLFRQVF